MSTIKPIPVLYGKLLQYNTNTTPTKGQIYILPEVGRSCMVGGYITPKVVEITFDTTNVKKFTTLGGEKWRLVIRLIET